jgi:fructose-1,6-bisphosphatase I
MNLTPGLYRRGRASYDSPTSAVGAGCEPGPVLCPASGAGREEGKTVRDSRTSRPGDDRSDGRNQIGLTFTQHVADRQKRYPDASGDLTALLQELMVAAKIISREVRKAGLVDALGLTGKVNVQGEEVQVLDDFADETIIRNVGHTGHLCVLSSEENEDIIPIPPPHSCGKYVLTFDPLDGSSNIDANVSIGTIFSIHHRVTTEGPGTRKDILQPGHRQVAAGYVIYGSSTILVYAAGEGGVFGFTLDPSVGEFLLSHPSIQIPAEGTIYSVNEGHSANWAERDRRLIDRFKGTDNPAGRPYSSRYVGSLVADFHRNLLYGGIFLYPPDRKHPDGKLRLLSEAAPMSFIAEAAGGGATTGRQRVLDVQPGDDLHQRVPLFIGSRREVAFVEEVYSGFD